MYEQLNAQVSKIANMMMDNKSKIILVKHDNSMDVNASIKKEDNNYIISLSSGVTVRIPIRMADFLKKYDEEDWKWFKDFEKFNLLDNGGQVDSKEQELKLTEKLSNLFASSIILNIVFHECGHIIANHVDSIKSFNEVTNKKSILNVADQEKEMVADWHSVIYHFWYMYSLIYGDKLKDRSKEDTINSLRQLTVFEWLSICYEFALFDNDNVTASRNKAHPHARIRLIACLEAMYEAIVDILDAKFQIDDPASTLIATQILNQETFMIVSSFCQLSDIDIIDKSWHDDNAIEQYIKLREYSESFNNAKPDYHLAALNSEDKEIFKKIVSYLRKN